MDQIKSDEQRDIQAYLNLTSHEEGCVWDEDIQAYASAAPHKKDWVHRQTEDIEDLMKDTDQVKALERMLTAVGRQCKQEQRRYLYKLSAQSAVRHGRTKCLACALHKGVDPNATTKQGNTLLHAAAYNNNEEMCRMLLEKGSEPDRVNQYGERFNNNRIA